LGGVWGPVDEETEEGEVGVEWVRVGRGRVEVEASALVWTVTGLRRALEEEVVEVGEGWMEGEERRLERWRWR